MNKLAAKSRERWPGFAVDDPRLPRRDGGHGDGGG
jgi:hypothetical protein